MKYSVAVERRLQDWRDSLVNLLDLLEGSPGGRDLGELRSGYDEMLAGHPMCDGVVVDALQLGTVPALRVSPATQSPGAHVVYFHGGAYLFGAPRGYLGLASRIAIANDAAVYLPDYRLAPEYPYPTPILDCVDAYGALLDNGVDPKSVFFVGDSAGGSLAVTVMIHARNRGWPLPAGATAISPWCDLEHAGRSMRTREGIDPLCTRAALDVQARAFLQGARPHMPDASPIYADVSGLPPVLIQVGEAEVMMSGAIRLAEHLAESGVRMNLEVWPNMFHVWPLFAAILPEGQAAIDSSAAFHRRCLADVS
jgi:monoterpene epsilon-lactone hydrolase